MAMSGYEVAAHSMTVGDFVMINALMIQLYMPLNFIGSVYRDIKLGAPLRWLAFTADGGRLLAAGESGQMMEFVASAKL